MNETGQTVTEEIKDPFTTPQLMQSAEIHNNQLNVLADLLADLGNEQVFMNPIELVCKIKLAQEYLEGWRRNLCPAANAEFKRVTSGWLGVKNWAVRGLATITNYAPASTWTFPLDVVKLVKKADEAKAKAKADKRAVQTPGTCDPATTFLFKIQLNAPAEPAREPNPRIKVPCVPATASAAPGA